MQADPSFVERDVEMFARTRAPSVLSPDCYIGEVRAAPKRATLPARSIAVSERPVVFRGIKIAPIAGKRSRIANAIREALRTAFETEHGEPPHA